VPHPLREPDTFAGTAPLTDTWRPYRRAGGPVWCPDDETTGFWSVFDYASAVDVLRDPARYTSRAGIRLAQPVEDLSHVSDRMLIVADGLAHRRLRRPHSLLLASDRLTEAVGQLRAMLARRIGQLCGTGEAFDLMREIAWPATALVTRALGFESSLHEVLQRAVEDGFNEQDEARAVAGRVDLFGLVVDQVLRGDGCAPWDDVDEAVLNIAGILNGGLETTPHVVATAAMLVADRAFDQHPRAERAQEVEEIIRLSSPAMHTMRTVEVDCSLRGVDLRAGDRVVVWLPACNSDPATYAAADQFRPGRTRSLAFGFGPHFCIGHEIARLEIDTVVEVLMAAPGELCLLEQPARRASTFVNGYEQLMVSFRPTTGRS
jgi:cytochrome P450